MHGQELSRPKFLRVVESGFKGGGENCLEDSEPNGNSSLLKYESNGCNADGELGKGGWSQKKDDADMN